VGLAIAALGLRAGPSLLRNVVGITQVAFAALLALLAAAGRAPPVVTAAFALAALLFLLAPILRRRRALWTAGALATIAGIVGMALSFTVGRNEVWGPLLIGGPGLLLAVAAWLVPEPARRRSVS